MLSIPDFAISDSLTSGKIYYAVSNRIMEFNLKTETKSKVFEAPHYTLFNYASLRGTDKIIFEVLTADKGDPIQSFNINNKQFESIVDGFKPTYINGSNTLYYYKYKDKRDTIMLYMMRLDDNRKEILITEGTKAQNTEPGDSFYVNAVYPVVPISNNEVIFINIDRELEIYNDQKKELQKTGIKDFIPFAWRSKTNTLICQHIDDRAYYEVNIHNSSKKKIPNLNRVTDNLLYIPDCDCLIYSKYRRYSLSERADIYVHWLSNNKEDKLWSSDRIMSAIWHSD